MLKSVMNSEGILERNRGNAEQTLPLTPERVYQTLKNQFYLPVSFPIDRLVLEEAIQSFFRFLEEPDAIKTHIDFTIAPLHRRGDVGFKHRDPHDHLYNDSKDFFHFHPALFEKYRDFLHQNPVVNDFVCKAHPIWVQVYETLNDIFCLLEPRFPGICQKVFDTEHPHILLRFLRYDWQESTKYLAKPHFDAGSFTLAIAESCPGLRIGSGPDDLQLVEHQPEQAIFMLSSNFQKVMASHDLQAGWHDVIQLNESLVGQPFSRWAIVAFIDAHGVEALSRFETHKWYTGEPIE